MATQIFLVRHGETEWSRSGRHTGRTDLALTEAGERAASGLRARLQGILFDHVLTSPRLRARRTCDLAGLGAAAQVDPDLAEWDYGDFEGLTRTEIHAVQPGWNIFGDGCPHGESVEQIAARADRVVTNLRAMAGTAILFSHGHFLRVLAVRWIGWPVHEGRHLALDTASLGKLGYERPNGDNPVIALWNAGPVTLPAAAAGR